jgi:hypothetical protein
MHLAFTSLATLKKNSSHQATMTPAVQEELADFVCASIQYRLMMYAKIPNNISWNISDASLC